MMLRELFVLLISIIFPQQDKKGYYLNNHHLDWHNNKTLSSLGGCCTTMNEAAKITYYLRNEYGSSEAKTYLVTGATSGIGLEAAKMLIMMNPLNRIFIVGRNERKARIAVAEVLSVVLGTNAHEHVIPLVCDHSSFDSVKQFPAQLTKKLNETYDPRKWALNGVDVLCLNAAVLQPNHLAAEFTQDDIEVTFQTNHLSPFLLVNLIHRQLNPGGRVVVSASGLHIYQKLQFDGLIDPRTGKAKKGFETHDGKEYDCKRNYAFSKLCNVALALELQERLRAMDISVLSFSPGLIRKTGLFRHHQTNNHPIRFPKDLIENEKSVPWGAGAMVYMATSKRALQTGGLYWHDPDSGLGRGAVYGKDFYPTKIPDSHISISGRKKLWTLSEELTGLEPHDTIPNYSERFSG